MGAKDLPMTTGDSDLASLFRRIEAINDEGKFREDLKAMVEQLGQAVTDLVAHIEDNDPKATADKLAKAIGALKMPAPQITVNPQVTVQAPQVTLGATLPPPPAPVIMPIERAPAGDETWEIRIKSAYGADKVLTITRKVTSAPAVARASAPKRLTS